MHSLCGLATLPVPGSLWCYARRLHQKPEKQRGLHSSADLCWQHQIAPHWLLETPSGLTESALQDLHKGKSFAVLPVGNYIVLAIFHVILGSARSENSSSKLHPKRQIYAFGSERLPARDSMAGCPRAIKGL